MAVYRLIVPRSVEKDLDRLAPEVRESCLFRHLPAIQDSPLSSPPLKGLFRGLRRYRFQASGGGYPIVYRVSKQERRIAVVMIGHRERLYEGLRSRVR